MTQFLGGVLDGLRGALYLVTHPRLWIYVLLPLVVAVLIMIAVVGTSLTLLSGPITALAAFLPGSWADNVLKLFAGVALTILSFTLLIGLAAVIAGPFNEMLSETIEERESGIPSPRFSLLRFLRDLVVGIAHALRRVSIYLVVMLALLVVGVVIPVVGSIVAAVLGAIATARFASYDAYDAVFSRKRFRYRQKVTYLDDNRARTWGLGTAVAAIVWIPGLNVVGLAIGATGATLRWVQSEVKRPADAQPAAR